MSRKSIGYFEGTDPSVLSALVCDGHDTIPISNGFDGHGRHVRQINAENRVDLLVGYLHKIFAPVGAETQAQDMFHVCRTYDVPFLVIVPRDHHACARRLVGECPGIVRFVDPSDLLTVARETLRGA